MFSWFRAILNVPALLPKDRKQLVLELLQAKSPGGMTCQEMALALSCAQWKITECLIELAKNGLIVDAGIIRVGKNKEKPQPVWFAV